MPTTGDLIENPVTGERAVVRVGTVEALVRVEVRPCCSECWLHWPGGWATKPAIPNI